MKPWMVLAVVTGSLGPLFLADRARAQDDADAVFAKPTPEHALLKREVGTWDAAMSLFMGGPDAPPAKYKAVETVKLIEGGLWSIGEYRGEFLGREFVGRSMMGYDPDKKKYVASWVDNATPRLMLLEGTYDEAKRTLTMFTESKDPATGQPVKEKHTHHFQDDDHRVFRMYQPGPDGKDAMIMEVVYTRRKS